MYWGRFGYAAAKNGWNCVTPASLPGFGSARRVGTLRRNLWPNCGGKTPIVVGSGPPCCERHVISTFAMLVQPCQLGYAGATPSPAACIGPGDHANARARSASLSAITHCLPTTRATTSDRRPGPRKGWGWEPDPRSLPNHSPDPPPWHPLTPCGAPCRARLDLVNIFSTFFIYDIRNFLLFKKHLAFGWF